jgi:dephospho-CoA kinase
MVGLTGGVGSGKSTVATMLAEHGAVVIDADAIAREVVAVGTPGHADVVARFGAGIVVGDGSLDRPALASIVFADPAALADLNAIVHPLVAARAAELTTSAPSDVVVVHDIPLLVEGRGTAGFQVVVVVETAMPLRLERLAERGLAVDQARARIAAQASDEQRRAVADELLLNNGTRQELAALVDALWHRLLARRDHLRGA